MKHHACRSGLLPALLMAALLLLAACDKEYSPKNADDARVSLDSIVLSLDKFAADNDGCYPTNFQDLLDKEYIFKLPFNGYKNPLPLLGAPRMNLLKTGQPAANGDFVYIAGPATGKPGICKNYTLYLYGDERDVDAEQKIEVHSGIKADRVIYMVSGERGKSVPGKRF